MGAGGKHRDRHQHCGPGKRFRRGWVIGLDPVTGGLIAALGGPFISGLLGGGGAGFSPQERFSFIGETGANGVSVDPRDILGQALGDTRQLGSSLANFASQPIQLQTQAQDTPFFFGGDLPAPIGLTGSDPGVAALPGIGGLEGLFGGGGGTAMPRDRPDPVGNPGGGPGDVPHNFGNFDGPDDGGIGGPGGGIFERMAIGPGGGGGGGGGGIPPVGPGGGGVPMGRDAGDDPLPTAVFNSLVEQGGGGELGQLLASLNILGVVGGGGQGAQSLPAPIRQSGGFA